MAQIIEDMDEAAIQAMMRGLDPKPVKVTDKKQLGAPDVGMVVWDKDLYVYKKRGGLLSWLLGSSKAERDA